MTGVPLEPLTDPIWQVIAERVGTQSGIVYAAVAAWLENRTESDANPDATQHRKVLSSNPSSVRSRHKYWADKEKKRSNQASENRTQGAVPVNVKHLNDIKKLALQGEPAAGASGSTARSRRGLSDVEINYRWLQNRLQDAFQKLPRHQVNKLVEAIPDSVAMKWAELKASGMRGDVACREAGLPKWAWHALDALDPRKSATPQRVNPVAAPMLSPVIGRSGEPPEQTLVVDHQPPMLEFGRGGPSKREAILDVA